MKTPLTAIDVVLGRAHFRRLMALSFENLVAPAAMHDTLYAACFPANSESVAYLLDVCGFDVTSDDCQHYAADSGFEYSDFGYLWRESDVWRFAGVLLAADALNDEARQRLVDGRTADSCIAESAERLSKRLAERSAYAARN